MRRRISRLRHLTPLPPGKSQSRDENDQCDLQQQAEDRGEAAHAAQQSVSEQQSEQSGAEESGGQSAEQSAAEKTGPRGACERRSAAGLRDRALLALLYGTGIRASECASLRNSHVDLKELTIAVHGKGGHERVVPLNPQLAELLRAYVQARGSALPTAPFFRSRFGRLLSRGGVYERVRTWGQRSRIGIRLSPHRMRHTFATHLVRAGVGLVTIRDLLGHRLITSTQVYLHVTADDLRAAAGRHPISRLLDTVRSIIGPGPLPFQKVRPVCSTG